MSSPGNQDMPVQRIVKEIKKTDDRIDLHIYRQGEGYVAVRIKGSSINGPEFVFDQLRDLHRWLGEELSLRFQGRM